MEESTVDTFIEVTGSDRGSARQYLESVGWDLQSAVAIFTAANDEGGTTGGTGDHMDHSTTDEMVARALAQEQRPPEFAGGFIPAGSFGDLLEPSHGSGGGSAHGGAGMSEDGVRAPIASFKDTLIGGRPSMPIPMSAHGFMSGITGPSGRPAVVDVDDSEWMFPPPLKEGNCGGDLTYARQRAKEERKWLLVNLQALDIFQSHQLNRDTWSNETIQTLLESSFIFWQRSSHSDAGRQYLNLYKVATDDLPEIAIIGPTGIKIYSQTGFVPPDELSSSLLEFLEQNSLDSKDAPKVRQRKRSTSGSANADASMSSGGVSGGQGSGSGGGVRDAELGMTAEDLDLERALRLSMAAEAEGGIEGRDAGSPAKGSEEEPATQALDVEAHAPVQHSHLPPNFRQALRDEPAKGTPETTRLQLRLADGRTLVRRFFLDDKIAAIYAIICDQLEEAATRAFTLQPPMNSLELLPVAESTLAEQDLTNSKIIMRWAD